jgi:AAA+ ATPase superfamily predicted ATPase
MAATNPFRFGALALDEAFADREQELDDLVADVLNGQDVVVLAPRRYGKSSLVWRATQRLVGERVLVAQVDLMTAPTKEKLAEKLAGSIYENIASTLERVRDRALAPFRGLRIQPTVTVNPEDGSFSFSFAASQRSADVDATLERLLQLPAELGAAKERRVALVMDEFQEIVDLDPALPKLLRAVFQQQPEVAHVYLGSRRHIMERIFNDENEPFWRSAKPIELGRIEVGAFAEFIAERFRSASKRINPETAAEVLRRTRGHPYATQELCYFLWEETEGSGEASGSELDRAVLALLRSEHAHFTLLWEGATPPQKLLLQALSHEQPGHPFRNEYRRAHGLPAPSALQRAARGLVERELVDKEGGAYVISEPFLAEWVSANVG